MNSLLIMNSTFNNCQGITGGAISINDIGNVLIGGGTLFANNTASQSGGAVYFYCNNYGLNTTMCSLTISNASFINNSAGVEGGALKWNFYEPTMSGLTFIGNTAGVYGNNIASVA